MRRLALAALLLAPLVVQAQPLSTDRPDFTEAAVSVQRPQIEMGATATRTDGATGYTFGEVLLRLPIVPRLEARLEGALGRAGGAYSASDVALGAKLALREGSPAFALLASVGLAALSDDARVQGAYAEAKLLGSVDLAPGLALASNLNVAVLEDTPELSASLSLGADLTPRVGAYLEGFVLHAVSPPPICTGDVCVAEAEVRPFVNAGLTFRPVPTFQLDVRAGVGHGRTVFGGAGVSIRL